MVVIEFEFPVEKDAYVFRSKINNFFSNSFFETEKQIVISSVKKDNSRNVWSFKLMFGKNEFDIDLDEKYVKISGGALDIMNGTKQVWAFA